MTICYLLRYTAIIAGTLMLNACDDVAETFEQSMRSGTVSNEYIEAPLSEKAKEYQVALETSNQFLSLWQKKDFQTIYDTLVDADPKVKSVLTVEKLREISDNVVQQYGELVEYKPMQWAFEPKRAKKEYFLFSIKTVKHEKGQLNYLFQFFLDGEYKQLAGFYVRETPTLRAPGQIHTNKQ